MPLIGKRDPWSYPGMSFNPALNRLHRKQYSEIKTEDFYNVDYNAIPMFVDPAKLILYRYLRLEPYYHEMFRLNTDLHPFHPLHPNTEEMCNITNKHGYHGRHVQFPLLTKKKIKTKVSKKFIDEDMKYATFFEAGLSESETHLSADEVTDWSSGDFESEVDKGK